MKVCLQTQILQINAIKPNGIDDDLAQGFHVLLVYISTDNAVLEIEVRRRNDNAYAICCSKGLVVTLPVVERIFAPGVTIVHFCREFLHVLGWLTVFLFVGVNHIIVLALYLSLAVSGLNHCLYHGDSLEFGVRIDLDHHFWSSHEVTDEDYSVGRDINLFGTLLDQFLAVARLVYESILITFSKNTPEQFVPLLQHRRTQFVVLPYPVLGGIEFLQSRIVLPCGYHIVPDLRFRSILGPQRRSIHQ